MQAAIGSARMRLESDRFPQRPSTSQIARKPLPETVTNDPIAGRLSVARA